MRWFLVLLIQLTLALSAESGAVFKIGLEELRRRLASGELGKLEDVLRTEGAIAVVKLHEEYEEAVEELKVKAPRCLGEEGMKQLELTDGSSRMTFARTSDEHKEFPHCIRREGEVISRTFDEVYDEVATLFTKVAGIKHLEWKTTDNEMARNLSSLSQKEHIHVYRPPSEISDQEHSLPFHLDNGLLLMLTSFNKHPLQIKNKAGNIVSTAHVGDGAILVLVASGLSNWLLEGTPSSSKFFPVPHAVPTLANHISSRTVFARMKMVPMNALPSRNMEGSSKEKPRLFAQFFDDITPKSSSELCPIMRPEAMPLQQKWKHMKSEECSGGQAYCWMNCLEVPSACITAGQNATCFNSKNEACCTDTDDKGNCVNMDDTCHWSCPADNVTTANTFCNGRGTDMYMTGFQATGNKHNNCVILLFPSWVLDSQLKFFFGCIGVIVLGIFIEYLLCVRRQLQSNKILIRLRNPWRKILIIWLFALNIGLGYFAMLVAMTYSVELFLCMVIGLVFGHAVFNSSAQVGESVDPCCASQQVVPPKEGQYL